jgi:hypothetical protein
MQRELCEKCGSTEFNELQVVGMVTQYDSDGNIEDFEIMDYRGLLYQSCTSCQMVYVETEEAETLT